MTGKTPLDILTYGNPVLRKKSDPIARITALIRRLADGMRAAMHAAQGVGLAAPQVGENLQLCIVQHPKLQPRPLTLINPVILEKSDELVPLGEGCLSLPNLTVQVIRPRAVRVRYMDLKNKPVEREFTDLLARIVQHEMDHLTGKLIVDQLDLAERLRFEARRRAT
ncbi:peptide deformylase [bacterium]|nr:peptide deformylase [bacterium]